MDASDFVEFGAGLGLGAAMSRSIGNAFGDALDARASMSAVSIPRTPAEIRTLLDMLDVRLANGEISEATYQAVTSKWQQRLDGLNNPSPNAGQHHS